MSPSSFTLLCACTAHLLLPACLTTHALAGSPLHGAAALAMEGGGFRALSSDAGVIAGLLAAFSQQQNLSEPTLASTGLLDHFQGISSVSGSSWFSAELIFSQAFLQLVESMAASPATAAQQFESGWTAPLLRATQVTEPKFDRLERLSRFFVSKLLGTGDEDTIYLAKYFLATGFTWDHFVDELLNSTAGLDPEVAMGSPVASWARGKTWLVDHSVLLPAKQGAHVVQGKFGLLQVSYNAASTPALPVFLPARFSTTLGAGTGSPAPLPYAAASATAQLQGLKFDARCLLISESFSSGNLGPDLANGSVSGLAGSLPVARTVAASSAFLGSSALQGSLVDKVVSDFEALFGANLVPWISSAAGGKAFEVAQELVEGLKSSVSVHSVGKVASAGIHGVIDGGFTDGTGISQAVAAGAQEVFVLLNSYSTNNPSYVEMLFAGGCAPPNPGVPHELFPVFESPRGPAVRTAFQQFHQLHIPENSSFLKVIAVGTIEAHTAANRYFGVEGGRSVKLNIVNVGSDLNIGQFENLKHYNQLAQEVMLALLDGGNAAFVQDSLLPMVVGHYRESPHHVRNETLIATLAV